EIDLFAEIEALLGLAADLMQDLYHHRPLDAAARKLRAQIVGREIARQAIAGAVGPSVGVPAGPPEMMMRVDHIHQGPGAAKASCPLPGHTLPADRGKPILAPRFSSRHGRCLRPPAHA